MKSNLIRRIIGGLSFTSALFIFQACYGTPQDLMYDVYIEGKVTSKLSGDPIKGIKVSMGVNNQYELTDDEGKFSLYTEKLDSYKLKFEDIDSTENRLYSSTDTIITEVIDHEYIEVVLEEKK